MEKKIDMEWEDLPEEKQLAINVYYHHLMRKHPQWKTAKILRKAGEYFGLDLSIEKDDHHTAGKENTA